MSEFYVLLEFKLNTCLDHKFVINDSDWILDPENPALSMGKLIHFPPENDIYIYFKLFKDEIILNVVYASDKDVEIDVIEYSQILKYRMELSDIYNSTKYN